MSMTFCLEDLTAECYTNDYAQISRPSVHLEAEERTRNDLINRLILTGDMALNLIAIKKLRLSDVRDPSHNKSSIWRQFLVMRFTIISLTSIKHYEL